MKIVFRKDKTIIVKLSWKSEFSHFRHLCIPPFQNFQNFFYILVTFFAKIILILHIQYWYSTTEVILMYNVLQTFMEGPARNYNPYIEGPSLIWIISFYCLIFLRRKHHAIFISLRKTRTVCILLLKKKGPYLLYRAYLTDPFKVLRSCWVRVETMLRLHGDRSVTTEMRPLYTLKPWWDRTKM